jgi:hypothetical protein
MFRKLYSLLCIKTTAFRRGAVCVFRQTRYEEILTLLGSLVQVPSFSVQVDRIRIVSYPVHLKAETEPAFETQCYLYIYIKLCLWIKTTRILKRYSSYYCNLTAITNEQIQIDIGAAHGG